MARKGQCKTYAKAWNPVTGKETRYCVARYGGTRSGGLSGLAGFGQTQTLKATVSSIKPILITGGIAAGGAIITKKVYARIGGSLNLSGWQRSLAEMATGIVLGIVIAKVLKKPKLAAAFAIGPIVSGAIDIFANVMGEAPAISGLGLTQFAETSPFTSMYAGMGSQTEFETVPENAYPGLAGAKNSRAYAGVIGA